MNEDELAELLGHCPTLYHMAERGSWPSILKFGLQSTTALLDRYNVTGEARTKLEARRRPERVALKVDSSDSAVLRDQNPMDDSGLLRCLQDGITPGEWYRTLNSKVFFWLTRDRLFRLTGAAFYRDLEHDVLEIDAKTLIQKYSDKVWLCPINSGCTKPFPATRGKDTFQRLSDYPYRSWKAKKRKHGERVVELAVDYAIPDIGRFVKRVVRMKGLVELDVVFEK